MIKRVIVVFVVIGAFFLSSCDSDSNEGKYYGNSISSLQTKLYTKAGEVKNSAVVNRFVSIHGDFEPNIDVLLSTYKCQATYLDPSMVVFKSLVTNTVDTMTVYDRDSLVIWESRDTVKNQYAQHYGAFKYKRLHYSEVQVNESMVITNYLNCWFLKRSGKDLLMPIIFYYHKKGSGGTVSERVGRGNNEFNPGYVAGFGDTDTVLVYRYTLRLRQQ